MAELFQLASVLLVLANAFGSLGCPENCNCQTPNEEFEMICPPLWNDWKVKVTVFRNTMEVTCNSNNASEIYGLLDARKTGPTHPSLQSVEIVSVFKCPLPENGGSIKEIFGLGNDVKKINLKSCDGQNLQRSHLIGFNVSLTHLSLIKCSISFLPDDVFQEVGSLLEELDMRENLLESVPTSSLKPLKRLKYLELGDNKLQEITEGSFLNLPSLKLLNLWGNKNIQPRNGSLSPLSNLTSLDLRDCGISSLPNGFFTNLRSLQNISLVANSFSNLPENLFTGTDLKVLKLFHNRRHLQLPKGLLANLENLKEIHLHNNGITELPENLIWNSPNIRILELQQNKLNEIPQSLLKNKTNLLHLDLSGNKLEIIPSGLFATANSLNTINLSQNKINTLQSGVLHGLHKLSTLDLSRNQISTIAPNAFPDKLPLIILDLSHNKLKSLSPQNVENGFGKWSVLNMLLDLEEINLSNNSIDEIYSDWRLNMPNLHKLDLSYNNISSIEVRDIQFAQFTPGNLTVNLSHSNLKFVYLQSIDVIAKFNPTPQNVHFILQGNVVDCGCSSYDFLRYVQRKVDPAVYKMVQIDAKNVTCLSTKSPVTQANLNDVLCDDSCCISPWQCKKRPWDRAWLLKCDGCWVDGKMPPAPSTFRCSPHMQHSELHLHNNDFRRIPKEVLLPELNITALNLSYNHLSELKISDITPFLEELAIDNNQFHHLDDEVITMLPKTRVKKITLYGNPWECDCDTRKLLQFLQDEYTKVTDRWNITCNTGESLVELTSDDLCPLQKMAIIVSSVCLAVFGVVIGVLAFLYYRYQQDIKVWLYARNMCLWFVTEEEIDRDKVYDAFVSYSHKDEEFVVDKLVAGLESGPTPFKLCLHYRDWIAGDWITEQIARSIERSCRTLVVLSPNFLESVWGKMEFRAAHRKALSEGRSRVIIVMYGEIGDLEKLDPELKAYLSTNTYVKWGDPWFWDKLKYALPHSRKVSTTMRSTVVSDKVELIVPSTPSPLVTPTTDLLNPLEKQKYTEVNTYNNCAFTTK